MNTPVQWLVGEQRGHWSVEWGILQDLDLVVPLQELEVTVEDASLGQGQGGHRVPVLVVVLSGPHHQRHRTCELIIGDLGHDVDLAGVAVQLKVLVLVTGPVERVEHGAPQANVLVKSLKAIYLVLTKTVLGSGQFSCLLFAGFFSLSMSCRNVVP